MKICTYVLLIAAGLMMIQSPAFAERFTGVVKAADASSFQIAEFNDDVASTELVRFACDAKTNFLAGGSLADLKVGKTVKVVAEPGSEGKWKATVVGIQN